MEQVSTSVNHKYAYCRDGDMGYRIKSLMFDRPLPLNEAVREISSDSKMTEELSIFKYFNKKTLNQIQSDLSSSDTNWKDIKVKGMIDYGQTAYVFETEDGDILKITSRDHFLGRKETELDNPIKSHEKLSPKSFCHYYLEGKTSMHVTNEEMDSFAQRVNALGYKIIDQRTEQFGKTKDGKVVIIDPECLRKKGVFGLLKLKYNKLKSFAKIALK